MFPLLEDLERHTNERPDSFALVSPEARITFSELKSSVDSAAIRLRLAGVTPRAVVAVDLPQAHEWIIDLALMRLATQSVSTAGVPGLGQLRADVLITAPGRRVLRANTEISVDERWFTDAASSVAAPVPSIAYPRSDSIFRLMLTSGTTGLPRVAAYSVSALTHRHLDLYWSDGRAELNFMPLSTTGGFHTAVANLRHGQPHRAVDRIDAETLQFASDEGVRVLCGSPVQVAAAMRVLTENGIALAALEEVRLAGASASPTLLHRIGEVFDVPVRGVYGSTEGGGVTTRFLNAADNPSNVGPALPNIELQIVDAQGSPLPPGVEGKVRYRSPGQVSGYLVNGEVESFPRGWFEPGDTGMLLSDGSLVLGGRDSEVVNIGGLKFDPVVVDNAATGFAGVLDAAAFGFERPNGVPELGIAVVAGPGCDLRELDAELRRRLPVNHPTAFWPVDTIPRNRMGKVERAKLRERFEKRATDR